MKFGLEIEKFLFDLKNNGPSSGVFSFIDALTDLELYEDTDPIKHVTNEFVLNLIEITTEASSSPLEVLRSYNQNYLLLKSVALREQVTMVPMGSMPMDYQPQMTPKWSYFVQNSILDRRIQSAWALTKESPLTPAGNCAGMHVHAEVETPREYLFSNRELMDKFNIGLMLTPMIAFSSSPYFFGQREGSSSRGQRYFYGVYQDHPHNGGLPPVMESSQDVLLFFQRSVAEWVQKGVSIGLPEEDLKRLTSKKGANWNPIRWNKQWNTIELRCLDSDRSDLDGGKFIWACGAFKRMDLKGENLKTKILPPGSIEDLVEHCFEVNDGEVSILPTEAITEIFKKAIEFGLQDNLVFKYLTRLSEFSLVGCPANTHHIYQHLLEILQKRETISDLLFNKTNQALVITREVANDLVNTSIAGEASILDSYTKSLG